MNDRWEAPHTATYHPGVLAAISTTPSNHRAPAGCALLTFDIVPLVAQLKGEETWHTGARNAMTLHKGPGLRIVLIAMHANTTIPLPSRRRPDQCPGARRCAHVPRAEAQAVTLRAGQLLTLSAGIPHVVAAEEESAFLLTMGTEVPALVERTPAVGDT